MRLTGEDLANIASWTPVCPGFDRDDATIEAHIRPIIDRLAADRRLRVRVTEDGGLSNYFAFLVHEAGAGAPGGGEARGVPCVVVQLSLMAPVGVFGRSTFSETASSFGWGNLEPDEVCDPTAPPDWISAAVVAVVHEEADYRSVGRAAYRLVGREVTDQPLPAGVEVYEYCLCAKPWNRAFHALFADTD